MNENVNVCITPKGDKPVLHFSQFDNERVFTVTVLADDGESAAVLTGLDIEFRIRKTDSHVVTIAPESVADNVITFKTTEQMCACCGQNIASVVLMKDDTIISTLDILVDIQRDILSGGLTSESDIRNLTTQIEQIVPEVIGDDYYTKTEVDELIDDIPTFDPSNYYDKNYINTMYWTAQQIDQLFYRKTKTDDLLSAKMDKIGYNGIVNDTAIISFNTDCDVPLPIIKGKIDPNPSGFSALNVTRTGKNLLDFNPVTVTTQSRIVDNFTLKAGNYVASFHIKNTTAISGYFQIRIGTTSIGGINFGANVEGDFSKSFTLTEDSTINILVSGASSGYSYQFSNGQIELGNQASDYSPYNGQTATVNFGQTITIGGDIDLTNGKITLTDDTEISVTPVTVSSIAGVNNIFLDTGNLTQIAYFEGVDDNLNKLIKVYQI